MTAFITSGQILCRKVSHKRPVCIFIWVGGLTDGQIDRVTADSKTDTFPQPVAEVIKWDSDPRQQSLLLVL